MCAIPPAGIDNHAIGTSAPDDHGASRFTSGPHCGVRVSSRGRVGGAGSSPSVRARNVLTARIQILGETRAAPHDHLCPGPDGCVIGPPVGCDVGGSYPGIGSRVVFPACAWEVEILIFSAPHDHLTRRPYDGVTVSTSWRVSCSSGCPAIGVRIIAAAGVEPVKVGIVPAPDDHPVPGPYGSV